MLGPEMKSTGEVMGVAREFGEAFDRAQRGANMTLPASGRAFISVRDEDKAAIVELAGGLRDAGFELVATRGTAEHLGANGVACERVNKVLEGQPHIVDMIKNDEISLIINTTQGKQAIRDSDTIRRSALQHKVALTTTIAGARAVVLAIGSKDSGGVSCLQDLHLENEA